MKNIALLYFSALAGIGCSSNSNQHNTSGTNEILFTCDRGGLIQVRFFQNKETAILVHDGNTFELQQEPSGSGFNYSNGSTSIRGKGNEVMVIIGRMSPIKCIAN